MRLFYRRSNSRDSGSSAPTNLAKPYGKALAKVMRKPRTIISYQGRVPHHLTSFISLLVHEMIRCL
jgi:hypothetical protein